MTKFDVTIRKKEEATFLCLHSQKRVTHWIFSFLPVRSPSRSFCLGLSWLFPGEAHGQVCSAKWAGARPVDPAGVKNSKWMSVNNNSIISYLKNPKKKKKKDAKMLWMYDWTCHLQDDSFVYQRTTVEDKWKICCIVKKQTHFSSILTLQVTSEGATSTGFCTYM